MENKVTLDKKNSEVYIENLKISNSDTYNFLKDKENLVDWITKALIIGCVGLRQMILTDNVDFVEKEFNKFIAKAKEAFEKQTDNINEKIETTFSLNNTQSPLFQMKELIDSYFNKDKGQIKRIIDDTFNLDNKKSALSLLIEELKDNSENDEKKLQELLDPNKSDSPARRLKEQILDKINEIRDKEIKDIRDQVMKENAINLEKQKGTSKGFVFEEEVHKTLQTLASFYEDTINLVGDKLGTGSKKGDILIELENKKNIIIECKDSSSYSSKKTIDEINDAMENRKASFGIFLFAKREEMPRELCPIKITDKYLVTYYDEDNLYFAYRIARLFVLRNRGDSDDKVNFEKISSELNTIEDNFKNIDAIQTKVTTIINSGEYVRENLKSLRDSIDGSVTKIKNALGENFEEEALNSIKK
ncbi:MAG: hypothetical protein Q8L29_01255 [archaeon]|nr:hypothetical protein [archaeon]